MAALANADDDFEGVSDYDGEEDYEFDRPSQKMSGHRRLMMSQQMDQTTSDDGEFDVGEEDGLSEDEEDVGTKRKSKENKKSEKNSDQNNRKDKKDTKSDIKRDSKRKKKHMKDDTKENKKPKTRGPILINIDFSIPRPVTAVLGTQTKRYDTGQVRQTLVKQFKVPTLVDPSKKPSEIRAQGHNVLGMVRRGSSVLSQRSLYDPELEGAVILYEPPVLSETEKLELSKKAALSKDKDKVVQEVHVVVDPLLGAKLRPHQVEGVRFLYDCTTGRKVDGAFGCIIADEMGLGKTFQCVTLLWTLIKQSPIPNKPTIEKAIICCPSSLVKNWANELVKWLGPGKLHPLACDGKESKAEMTKKMEQFVSAKGRGIVYPVLIISYETLRIYSPLLQKEEIGLLLCDEGHRLKNAESLTYQALHALKIKRRVIMSGTPIQNDLTEYFSLLNFANPGLLGTDKEFRKNFELPILRGRDALATDKERQISEEKLTQLYDLANKFIIRRTAELLTKYLPIKYEHVVFCKFTPTQNQLYKHMITSPEFKKLLSGVGSQPLKSITLLRKICNHPALLEGKDLSAIKSLLPPEFDEKVCQSHFSGKMLLLEKMLDTMRKTGDDKIVVISNYTQTLDLIEKLCRQRLWGVLRLDGTMTIPKRQKLVDRFNDPTSPEFVFLLSSKAGGCGINLIGANRLVLFDPDWNPAADGQALARVWRDGQKKTCYLYRFIATGSIEEKVLMRQAHKNALSSCVVDEDQEVERHFSLGDLRQLFQLKENTMSEMHDTFKCKRCVSGRQVIPPVQKEISAGAQAMDTSTWNHFSELELGKVYDSILREIGKGIVSFVFQNKSHEKVLMRG